MKKRLLTYFMTLTMVASLLPTTALANDIDEINLDDIVWEDEAVEEEDYQVYWTYVTNEDGSVTAIENELLTDEDKERMSGLATVSSAADTNAFGLTESELDTDGMDPYGAGDGAANFNAFNELIVDSVVASSSSMSVFALEDSNDYDNFWKNEYSSASTSLEKKAYSRVVALDAEGIGKQNFFARVGVEKDGSDYWVDLYEMSTDGRTTYKRASVDLGDIAVSKDIQPREIGSFLDIVAGDFDGDGKEEFAVTNMANVTSPDEDDEFVEIYGYTGSSLKLEKSIDLDDYIIGYSQRDKTSATRSAYPVISLTAGALYVDNDVTDDLIISLSSNDWSTDMVNEADDDGNGINYDFSNRKWIMPTASVLIYSSQGSGEIGNTPTLVEDYQELERSINSTGGYTYSIPRNMSTAIGDVDYDGRADLVVACESSTVVTKLVFTKYKASSVQGEIDANSDNTNIYNYATAYTTTDDSIGLSSKMGGDWSLNTTPDQLYRTSDTVMEPVAMTTYAYAGSTDKEYLYLEGNTYEFDTTNQAFSYTDSSGRAGTDWDMDDWQIAWISEVAVGNVFDSASGNEAVFQTCITQHTDATYSSDISYVYCNEKGSWDNNLKTIKNNGNYDISLSMALVDYDDDGVIVKLNTDKETDYYFTDPDIMAVLQAAPRFVDLDEASGDYATSGTTALTNSETASSEVSNGLSISAGVSAGFEYEISLLGLIPIGGISTSVTTTASFSSSWSKSKETTSSITYTSESDADRVVLSMIPYVRYNYLMWVPEFVLMSEDEYNDYVEDYEYYLELAEKLEDKIGSNVGYGSSDDDALYVKYMTYAYENKDQIDNMDSILADGYNFGDTVTGIWQEYEVSVPETPITAIMTVDSFDKVASSLGWDKIRDNVLPSGYTVGYPSTYATSTDGLDNWGAAATAYNAMRAGGGSTTLTLEATESNTTSLSYGMEVEREASGMLIGFTAGFSNTIGYEGGYSWSDGTGVAYEGAVQNAPAGYDSYSFDWLFGSYTASFNADPDEEEYDALVLGYILKNVSSPPSVPVNFEVAETTMDSITLTWEKSVVPASNYILYRVIDGEDYAIATLDGSVTEYTATNLTAGTAYSFKIVAKNATLTSAASAVVTGRTTSEAGGFTATLEDETVSVNPGSDATFKVVIDYDEGVTGLSDPTYVWQTKENSVWVNIENSNSSTYTISDVDLSMDETEYRCVVTQILNNLDPIKSTTETGTLSVGLVDTTTTLTALNASTELTTGPASGTATGSQSYYVFEVVYGETTYSVVQFGGTYYLENNDVYYEMDSDLADAFADMVNTYGGRSGSDAIVVGDYDTVVSVTEDAELDEEDSTVEATPAYTVTITATDETDAPTALSTDATTTIGIPVLSEESNLGEYTLANGVYTANERTFRQMDNIWYETTTGAYEEIYDVKINEGGSSSTTTETVLNNGDAVIGYVSELELVTTVTGGTVMIFDGKMYENYTEYKLGDNVIYLAGSKYYLENITEGTDESNESYDEIASTPGSEEIVLGGTEYTNITVFDVDGTNVYVNETNDTYYNDGTWTAMIDLSGKFIIDETVVNGSYKTTDSSPKIWITDGDVYYTVASGYVLVGTSASPTITDEVETSNTGTIYINNTATEYIGKIEVGGETYYNVSGYYYTGATTSMYRGTEITTSSQDVTLGGTSYDDYKVYTVGTTDVYALGGDFYTEADGEYKELEVTGVADSEYDTIEVGSTTVYVQEGVLYDYTPAVEATPDVITYTALTSQEGEVETDTDTLSIIAYDTISQVAVSTLEIYETTVPGTYEYGDVTIKLSDGKYYLVTPDGYEKLLTTDVTSVDTSDFSQMYISYTQTDTASSSDATVTLSTTVTRGDDGDVEAGTKVTFSIKNTTTNTTTVMYGTTDEDGNVTVSWTPTVAGVYNITATYDGSSLEQSSTSDIAVYYVTDTSDAYFVSIIGSSSITYGEEETYAVQVFNGTTMIEFDDDDVKWGLTTSYGSPVTDGEFDVKAEDMSSKTLYAKYTNTNNEVFTTSFKVSVAKKSITITAVDREVELSTVSADENAYANQTTSASSDWIAVKDSDGTYEVSEAYDLIDILNASYNVIPTMGDYTITLSYDSTNQTDVSDFKTKYNPTFVTGTYEVTGEQYKITYFAGNNGVVTAKDNNNSTVSSGQTMVEGYTITFTATPETGYVVEKWVVNNEELRDETTKDYITDTKYEITLPSTSTVEDYDVEVYFVAARYKVENDATEHGTVTAKYYDALTSTADDTFKFGDEIFAGDQLLVTATPEDGYVVSSWGVSTDGGDTYTTILADDGTSNYTGTTRVFSSITKDTTIQVNFAPEAEATITLKILDEDLAAVSGVAVTFNGVTATYVEDNVDTEGVDESGYVYTGFVNDNVTMALSVPSGIKINSWSTGTVSSDKSSATLYAISGDTDVTVNCAIANNYEVSFGATLENDVIEETPGVVVTAYITGQNGSIESGDTQSQSSTVNFTAVAEKGYEILGWTLNGVEIDATQNTLWNETYTVSNLSSDGAAIVVTYRQKPVLDITSYTDASLSVAAIQDGVSVTLTSGSEAKYVDYDSTITVTATPPSGKIIVDICDVPVNSEEETGAISLEITNIIANKKITANWGAKPVITITEVTNGTILVTGTVDGVENTELTSGDYVDYNTDVTVVLTPATGYEVDTTTDETVFETEDTSDVKSYTISAVTADTEIDHAITEIPTMDLTYSVYDKKTDDDSAGLDGTLTATVARKEMESYLVEDDEDGSETVYRDSTITFTATPDDGYTISEWIVNGVVQEGKEAPTFEITTTDAIDVQVQFDLFGEEIYYSLNDASGEATISAINKTTNKDFSTGSVVTTDSTIIFTVDDIPDGYHLESWTVLESDSLEPEVQENETGLTFTYSAVYGVGAQVVANIVRDSYTVTFSGTNGTVTAKVGEDSVATGDLVVGDTVVTFTVAPDSGYTFEGWKVNGVSQGTETTLEVTITENTVITAPSSLTVEKFTVDYGTYDGDENGTIAASGNITTGDAVAAHSNIVFTATPVDGYQVASWYVDDAPVPDSAEALTYTVEDLLDDVTVEVAFIEIPTYTITLTAGSYGTLAATVNGEDVVLEESKFTAKRHDEVVVTATPDTYFYTSLWTVDGTETDNTGNTYTIEDLLANTTIQADFASAEMAKFTAYVVNGNGTLKTETGYASDETMETIDPEKGVYVTAGKTIKLTAIPDKDDPETSEVVETEYMVKTWTVNDEVQDNLSNTLVIETFTAATTVTVEYEPLVLHAIPVSVDDSYEVTSVDKTPADYGTAAQIRNRGDVTFTITPESGKYITSLVIGGVELVSVAAELADVTCADSMSYTMVGTSYVITLTGVKADVVAEVTAWLYDVQIEELTSESKVTVKEWDEEKEDYIDVVVTGATVTSDMMTDVTTEIGTPTAVITQEVQLMVGTVVDGEVVWTPATEENFPDNGITIQLPLPEAVEDKTLEELQKSNYEFVVVHYIVSPINGEIPGTTEVFTIEDGTMKFVELEDGSIVLELTVFSLSPFAIAYTYTDTSDDDSGSTGGSSGGGGGGGGGSSSSDDDEEEEVVEEEIVVEGDELTHESYISGYADGTFKPNNSMTRAEALTMFANLMEDPMDKSKTYSTSFTDVVDADWFKNIVGFMEEYKIISGYDDGTFGGNNTITRAEFVAVAVRFAGVDMISGNTFSDIASSNSNWASDSISTAVAYGWVSGYEDGTFMPDKQITRAEAVTVINNIMNRSHDADYLAKYDVNKFSDVSETHWAFGGIMEASVDHTYVADGDSEIWVDTE